jgi:hypothetical protein
MMVTAAVLATASPIAGYAAEEARNANYACQITSPERGDAARATLSINHKGNVGSELTRVAINCPHSLLR